MKIKLNFMFIIELIIPLVFSLLGIIGIYCNQFANKHGINFFLKLVTYSTTNLSTITPVIATIGTVFCALVITSLSVLGSTVSHAVTILAQEANAVKTFLFYAICSLLGSSILFLMSVFPIFSVKLYLSIFIISFASLWAYTTASLYMFYLNIINVRKENQNSKELLGEVKLIKNELKNIKKHLFK